MSNNYHSNVSNSSRNKQSIIYKVSNLMSSSRGKDGKNSSSRSKIPMKNPPVQFKSNMQSHVRMKTEMDDRSSVRGYDDFSSGSRVGVVCLKQGVEQEQNVKSIKSIKGNIKTDRSFKFYDDDETVKSSSKVGD